MNETPFIKLNDVTKKFKKTVLLEQVNFSIHKGQSIALRGKNGVGKSTLLKMISGLSLPTEGVVVYDKRLSFSYVPDHFPKSKLTPLQYLKLVGQIDGFSHQVTQEKITGLLKDFFMEQMVDTPLAYLSKGSLQKVNVIQGILKRPDVLLLDEPLSGQDASSQRVFIEKMKGLLAQETTLIMSCHETYLMNELSDVVVEIKNQQLEIVSHKKHERAPKYSLHFVDEKGDLPLPTFECPVDKVGQTLNMYVDSSKTDEIIGFMLNQGWSLRGMYHEENN